MAITTRNSTSFVTSTKTRVKDYIDNFFLNRAPRQNNITLSLHNIYIFFSREGILFAFLLLITFIAGINYGNNLVLGLCFYLSSIWLITIHLTFSHLSGLKIEIIDVSMAEAGNVTWATIKIINPSSRPSRQLYFHFDHSHIDSSIFGMTESELNKKISYKIISLENEQTIRLPILTTKRGYLELPRLILSTIYPIGVMRSWSYIYFAKPAWVYPKPYQFNWKISHTLSSDDESVQTSFQTKGQNDFDVLDEYQEGESLSRISWVHLARGHGMLTKHFADSTGREITLNYADMPAKQHERKLEQLAFAVKLFGDTNQPFIMNLPNDMGKLGHGKEFINETLLRLAKAP